MLRRLSNLARPRPVSFFSPVARDLDSEILAWRRKIVKWLSSLTLRHNVEREVLTDGVAIAGESATLAPNNAKNHCALGRHRPECYLSSFWRPGPLTALELQLLYAAALCIAARVRGAPEVVVRALQAELPLCSPEDFEIVNQHVLRCLCTAPSSPAHRYAARDPARAVSGSPAAYLQRSPLLGAVLASRVRHLEWGFCPPAVGRALMYPTTSFLAAALLCRSVDQHPALRLARSRRASHARSPVRRHPGKAEGAHLNNVCLGQFDGCIGIPSLYRRSICCALVPKLWPSLQST